jgi:hypothetical protein
VLKPSNSRSWNALRNGGESCATKRSRLLCSSKLRLSSSGLGSLAGNWSDKQNSYSAPNRSFSDRWGSRGRLRNCIRAQLVTMAVNHVDICAWPLNWSRCLYADSSARSRKPLTLAVLALLLCRARFLLASIPRYFSSQRSLWRINLADWPTLLGNQRLLDIHPIRRHQTLLNYFRRMEISSWTAKPAIEPRASSELGDMARFPIQRCA